MSAEISAVAYGSGGRVSVLAMGEDRCADLHTNLPGMAGIAASNPNVQLHFLPHDQHHDLMRRYLFRAQGQSIPAFGCFDESLQEFATHTGGPPMALGSDRSARRRRIPAEMARALR